MNPMPPIPAPPTSNTFEGVLRNQRKGVMALELSEALERLTRTCTALCKGGTLVLKLKLNPATGDGAAFSVEDEITIKEPVPDKGQSLFYSTEGGQLVRENPEQRTLNLKVVGEKPADLTPATATAV